MKSIKLVARTAQRKSSPITSFFAQVTSIPAPTQSKNNIKTGQTDCKCGQDIAEKANMSTFGSYAY
jgi:hypothetical protein